MDKIRLGLIGLGNMGCNHATNILVKGLCPEVEIAAVADIDPARIAAFQEKFGADIPAFASASEMEDGAALDAILIAVPHYDHPTLAIEAMKKGLHVMCEKPAGVYTKQVKEMNAVAKESGVIFGMMFNQRTNCVYRKMRELVKEGGYGEIRRTNWIITNWYRPQAYYDSGAWRATWSGEGGGVLLNQCPHNLDLWQWICGMPAKVFTKMQFGKWHDIEVEDDVTTFVEYPNGATGTFITTTGDYPGTNRFEVTMDKAKLVVEDEKLYLWELETAEPEFSASNTIPFGHPAKTFIEVETDGKNEKHPGVLNAFAAAILRGEPLVAEGIEGINGLTLSNAMHLSAWLGKEIELPFDDDLYFELLMERVKTSRRKENVAAVAAADLSDTYNS